MSDSDSEEAHLQSFPFTETFMKKNTMTDDEIRFINQELSNTKHEFYTDEFGRGSSEPIWFRILEYYKHKIISIKRVNQFFLCPNLKLNLSIKNSSGMTLLSYLIMNFNERLNDIRFCHLIESLIEKLDPNIPNTYYDVLNYFCHIVSYNVKYFLRNEFSTNLLKKMIKNPRINWDLKDNMGHTCLLKRETSVFILEHYY